MKLPFYLELIEEESIEISTTAGVAKERLYKIFKQRNLDTKSLRSWSANQSAPDLIIPTNVYFSPISKCFNIKISDNRKSSHTNYINSYYARLRFNNTTSGKSVANVSYVLNHAYTLHLLLSVLICLAIFIILLCSPIPSEFKTGVAIGLLTVAIIYGINVFTHKKNVDVDMDKLRDAVKKYTDMINRWDD